MCKRAEKTAPNPLNHPWPKKFLDFFNLILHNTTMNIIPMTPEAIEVANLYLTTGSLIETANELSVPPDKVSEILDRREVRSYLDQVFLDQGYRNRSRLGALLDKIIDSKLEEAEESEMYTNKDLADLIQQAHKMRMDEIKATKEAAPRTQINTQIDANPFGQGKYGELLQKLIDA